MTPERKSYSLSDDQPILRRARRRSHPRTRPEAAEADFWRHFNLEKFARDWRRGVGLRAKRPG